MTKNRGTRREGLAARVAFLALLGLSVHGLRLSAGGQGVEDCVAAVVNGRAVTLVDVKIALRFGLYAGELRDVTPAAVLDRLVEQKLVLEFARGPASPGEEEIAAAAASSSAKMGPGAWDKALLEFGIEVRDLRPFLEEMLLYGKAVAARFSQAAPVTIREIEAYYADVYAPARRTEGAEPEPMVQVLDRIESYIQDRKREDLVAAWIANLKTQAEVLINRDCLQ